MDEVEYYKELLDHSLSTTLVTDLDYHFIYANEPFYKLFLFSKKELEAQPLNVLLLPSSGRSFIDEMKDMALKNTTTSTVVLPVNIADGSTIDLYIRCSLIDNGKHLMWSGTDVSLLINTEEEMLYNLQEARNNVIELEWQKRRLGFALEYALALVWEIDLELKRIEFSDNFEHYLGIKQGDYDYDFMKFIEIYLKPYKKAILQSIKDYLNGNINMIVVEISLYDSQNQPHWYIVRGKYTDDEKNRIYGVSVEITEQKLFEKRLSELAYTDIQTGLFKLEYIFDILAGLVKSVQLNEFGIMILDIIRFRNINEAFGHKRGNQVLIYAAEQLKALIGEHILVRGSGDEFLIIFNQVTDPGVLLAWGKRIRSEFEKPLEVEGQSCYLNFKIGIALRETAEDDFNTTLQDAQIALHHAKKDKVSHVCIINETIRKHIDETINMTNEIRCGILKREFYLDFQPIISTKEHKLMGAEVLIRWRNPRRGLISPLQFIPLAEENGLIIPIGDFVLEESMKQLKKWICKQKDFSLSINVSTIQFMAPNFLERLKELIKQYSIPPTNLGIEITESVFISEESYITHILQELREMGVRISLDDFGTGYSSLSYLKKIPLDNLKIDRNFLMDVLEDATSKAILQSIITLAKNLKLSVTAEGVETKEQLSLLEEYRCDLIQGYYFSKPVSPEKIDEFILKGD